jgi:hypothetical protein
MGRINQDIVEYSFNKTATLSYDLTILVGTDSFYYMVNDAQMNVLVLRSYHFDFRRDHLLRNSIHDVIADDPILREPFRSCKIAFSAVHFTLIPEKMFDPRELSTYFAPVTTLSAHESVAADAIKSAQLHNVYAKDNDLTQLLSSYFPNQQTFHHLSALIQGIQRIAEVQVGHQIFANLRDGKLQIFFFEGRNLIFTNTFSFRSPQDALYKSRTDSA